MTDLADAVLSAIGANDEQQEVEHWLDTGFAPLNKSISGRYDQGIPSGRIIEIFGPSACGKTAIATNVMASAQRQGGIAVLEDHENAFDLTQGLALGLSDEPGRWVYKQPETFEQSVDMVVKLARVVREKGLIADDAPICAVFDSLASMVPQSKFYDNKGNERETGSYNMHDNTALARCTSAAFPALAQFATKYNVCLVFLNQIREKPGITYGDPTSTPGGKAPEYYASVRLSLTRELIKDSKDKSITLGQDVKSFVKKNRVNRPFERANWRFMFREDGSGCFDVTYSTLEYMKENKLIEVAGNYLVWEGKKYFLSELAKKIDAEGLQSQLRAMLVDPT